MPFLKLSRINRGGEIFINTDLIRFIEIDTGSTTINMGPGNVYAVMETPAQIARMVEESAIARFREAIQTSGILEKLEKKTEII